MTLRILLAESGIEETLFLNDVLTELDGARCWSDWVHLEASHAATWADTAAILETEAVDVLLLDPDLRDSQGADTFRRAQAAAPHVPVILLVEASAISLAERMVRDGAQDFLIKKELDCAPLARAIRNAVERHRLLAAARSTCMIDQLTGLLTRSAFLTLADRDRLLAERLHRRMMVMAAEHADGGTHSQGTQRQDLAMVEAADCLRILAGPAALVARLSQSGFGVSVLDTESEPVEQVQARFQAAASNRGIVFGATLFEPHHPVPLDALLEQASRNLRSPASGSGMPDPYSKALTP